MRPRTDTDVQPWDVFVDRSKTRIGVETYQPDHAGDVQKDTWWHTIKEATELAGKLRAAIDELETHVMELETQQQAAEKAAVWSLHETLLVEMERLEGIKEPTDDETERLERFAEVVEAYEKLHGPP